MSDKRVCTTCVCTALLSSLGTLKQKVKSKNYVLLRNEHISTQPIQIVSRHLEPVSIVITVQ